MFSMECLNNSIFPAVGVSRPANILNNVVLPEPDWPITAIDSAFDTLKVISASIVSGPSSVETTLLT